MKGKWKREKGIEKWMVASILFNFILNKQTIVVSQSIIIHKFFAFTEGGERRLFIGCK